MTETRAVSPDGPAGRARAACAGCPSWPSSGARTWARARSSTASRARASPSSTTSPASRATATTPTPRRSVALHAHRHGRLRPRERRPDEGGHRGARASAAIAEADVIVFVTDATTGLTDADRAAVAAAPLERQARHLRREQGRHAAEPTPTRSSSIGSASTRCSPVSALHGRGIGELEAAHRRRAARGADEPEPVDDERLPRIALVGRPNAGKSSLLNRILGEDRMLVDDAPRHDARLDRRARRARTARSYVFIDTAGIRRKGQRHQGGQRGRVAQRAAVHPRIERAHVVVLMCDAHEGVAEQDAKILGLAEERGRGMVIALNKSDLLDEARRPKRAEELARDKISFAPYRADGAHERQDRARRERADRDHRRVRASFGKRVGTGELNRFFAEVLELRPPPTMGAKAPRLYYVTQAEARPPKFIVITNAPDSVHFSYQRFVVNQLRKRFGFEGVPVRVTYKAKRRTDRAERMIARAEATAEVRPRQESTRPARAGQGEGARAGAPVERDPPADEAEEEAGGHGSAPRPRRRRGRPRSGSRARARRPSRAEGAAREPGRRRARAAAVVAASGEGAASRPLGPVASTKRAVLARQDGREIRQELGVVARRSGARGRGRWASRRPRGPSRSARLRSSRAARWIASR